MSISTKGVVTLLVLPYNLSMELESIQVSLIRLSLLNKTVNRLCPSCEESDWKVGLETIELKMDNDPYIVVPLICDNCGYFKLHDFKTLGL